MMRVAERILAGCQQKCAGVEWRPKRGHLPRGLWLDEQPGDDRKENVIIVGQNPGNPSLKEVGIYKAHASAGVETLVTEMNKYVASDVLKEHAYYKRLRDAARQLGFEGRIIWTDLVKCSAPDRKKLPVHAHTPTYARCMHKWLRAELEDLPRWPVLAAGRATFDALWPLFPDRKIIGVPHPTGSRGGFARLFPKGKLAPAARTAWKRACSDGPPHFYFRSPSDA